jgi:hypothetical protein
MIEFLVYYQLSNGKYRTYNYLSKEYKTINILPTDISNFYIPKNKKFKMLGNDEGLKTYAEKLYDSRTSLLKYCKFDYILGALNKETNKRSIRTHNKAIEAFFYIHRNKKEYEHFEPISNEECELIDLLNKGYMAYIEKGQHNIFEYDYKGFYQSCLTDDEFYLVKNEGKYKNLKKLPEQLSIGFYFVKIECDNPEFKKLFMFNKNNLYTKFDLLIARKHQEEFDVKIEFTKEKNNAYVYEVKKDCIKSKSMFNDWADELNRLKSIDKLKDNILLKGLSSQLSGHLRKKIKYTMTEEQVDDLNEKNKISFDNSREYQIINIIKNGDKDIYRVINTNKQYFYPFRMCFLISFGRMKIAELAYKMGLENIKRICCDGICTTKEFDFEKENKNNHYKLVLDKKGLYELDTINQPIKIISC